MYTQADVAQVDVSDKITGYQDDFRRMQVGIKFEF
jgi:hypothetical protein